MEVYIRSKLIILRGTLYLALKGKNLKADVLLGP